MKYYLKFFFFLVSVSVFNSVFAQEDCLSTFQDARRLFDQGRIGEIPEMLAPCIESGFTRTQKIEAYKLIILAYLFDDDQYAAEKNMLEFLRKYPEYEIMPTDPVEFVYLFESYKTQAILSMGITFGPNLANPRIIEPYNAGDVTHNSSSNKSGLGFQAGFNISRYISDKLFMNIGINYTTNQYSFEDDYYNADEMQFTEITFKEKITIIDIPVTIAYEISSRSIDYYLCTGISVGRINKVTGKPSRTYDVNSPPITGADISMNDFRVSNTFFSIIGAGFKYKVPRGYLMCDIRFNIGLNNIINVENRFESSELWSKYFYVDDDYSINYFTLTFGYYFS
ncbi:MAG: PorT family protein, partial [Bacteroidales bacterium]